MNVNRRIENCRNKDGFINMDKLINYKEKGIALEGSNAKSWYNVNGTRVLYKEYGNILACFGEVMYYRAALMCGVDCAQYDFAICEGKVGTISYDFLNVDECYYNFLELTSQFGDSNFDLENITSNQELLIIQNNKYNNLISIRALLGKLFHVSKEQKREIERGLIKLFCLDTLFWHQDRTLWNNGIAVDEEEDTSRLAPAHDNSYVLCLNRGADYIEECIIDFINGGVMGNNNPKYSSFELVFEGDDSIEQLINFYENCDDEMRETIGGVINSLDVDMLLRETMQDCKIGDVPALWIKAVLNFRKKTILRGFESVKIKDDEAQMPNVTFSKRK